MLAAVVTSCGGSPDEFLEDAPMVVRTSPADGETDVDPSLDRISATFSESMLPGGWSWVTEAGMDAPVVTGFPHYTDNTTNVLPVRLAPDTSYVLWVNSPDDANLRKFTNQAGISARAHRFTFRTLPLAAP